MSILGRSDWGRQCFITHALQSDHTIAWSDEGDSISLLMPYSLTTPLHGLMRETVFHYSCLTVWPHHCMVWWGRQYFITHALQSDHTIAWSDEGDSISLLMPCSLTTPLHGLMRETVFHYSISIPCYCTFSIYIYQSCIAVWPQQLVVCGGRQRLLTVTSWACCTVTHCSMTTVLVCWGRQHPTTVTSSAK